MNFQDMFLMVYQPEFRIIKWRSSSTISPWDLRLNFFEDPTIDLSLSSPEQLSEYRDQRSDDLASDLPS